MTARQLTGWILPSAITLVVGAITFLPICDLNFDCGCLMPWAGAVDHCDIHQPGPPNCPWCHHAWMGYAAMAGASLAGIAALLLAGRRRGWLARTLLGLVGFHLALFAIGIVTSLAMGTRPLAGLL